ncbi:MAG: response regulator transcription factor [Dehalococcoidia bacterium]|nr:response regulator transcription factor [Dehalococcoidia bacterium]
MPEQQPVTTRILIADDHTLVRSGLKLILSAQPDFELVGEAATGEETIVRTRELQPDVLLLDIGMPGMNGVEAARVIRQQFPEVRIVVLTMYDDDAYLQQFLQIGAAGYVMKQAADEELVSAIRAVQRGESFIHPSLTRQLIDLYLKQSQPVPSSAERRPDLSPRETEVLRLVALGYSAQQIATELGISVSTVETHRTHVSEKLGLHGRAQLVRYALNAGLLGSEGQ